jgi:hypothetical protein
LHTFCTYIVRVSVEGVNSKKANNFKQLSVYGGNDEAAMRLFTQVRLIAGSCDLGNCVN